MKFRFHSRGGAYAALALLTLLWGMNWIVMKAALFHAHPVEFNVQRTWLATLVLFGVLIARGGRLRPQNLKAIAVTGFFQTTINFGATTMAVAGGGAGRTSVLVFTMPFWTLLIARFVLHERVRGLQAVAIVCAFAGLLLVVAPWSWQGDLTPKLWAALSGFGWAAGTVAMKYYQRDADFDMLNFVAWQMLVGILPLTFLPWLLDVPATQWSVAQALLFFFTGAIATAGGFLLWMAILRVLPAGTASLNMFAVPVIALVASMVIFDERLAPNEWLGIALIGAGLALIMLAARLSGRRAPLPATPTPVEGG
ncbi:MAG TPA: DMT family transporter [Casimicrobiaceae bacterium]|nr:DMT family transporter [Casimicrobiaceae bacterium]HWD15341.1 DMT family transporter [Casimicrobiaceae bacterium]